MRRTIGNLIIVFLLVGVGCTTIPKDSIVGRSDNQLEGTSVETLDYNRLGEWEYGTHREHIDNEIVHRMIKAVRGTFGGRALMSLEYKAKDHLLKDGYFFLQFGFDSEPQLYRGKVNIYGTIYNRTRLTGKLAHRVCDLMAEDGGEVRFENWRIGRSGYSAGLWQCQEYTVNVDNFGPAWERFKRATGVSERFSP